MDLLEQIKQILKAVAESHAEADRQRAKDKADADEQRAKDKKVADEQRAKDKKVADEQRAQDKTEADRQRAKDKKIADEQRAQDKAEADKRAAEYERQRAQDKAEADKRAAEYERQRAQDKAEADKERAELRAQIKRSDILIGRMDNRFGDIAESMLVGDVVETLKTIDNLHLEHGFFSAQNLNGRAIECEIDALLVGQESIVVMEAKSTLTVNKVEKFIDSRLNQFTELFPYFADKKIYGAVGYLKTVGNAVQFAMNEGLLVVRSTLQAKEVVNPKEFQPKDYNPKH